MGWPSDPKVWNNSLSRQVQDNIRLASSHLEPGVVAWAFTPLDTKFIKSRVWEEPSAWVGK